MEIFVHSIYILFILFAIVGSCVVFTNAIEHLGEKLNLSEGAVGCVLAAVGTALPETIVPLVAILGAYIAGTDVHVGHEIGIGGILGAPFLLGTLAFFVSGLAVLVFAKAGMRDEKMPVNTSLMFRDFHYFALAYTVAVAAAFIPSETVKHVLAGFLILFYGVYVFKTLHDRSVSCDCEEELEPLYIGGLKNPFVSEFSLVVIQVLLSLLGIIVFAHFFVENLKFFAETFAINPMILSLIITPIATELPEKFNSVIWIKAKKDTLAMGNVTGAMVFQSCIPTAVGLSLTPWVLNVDAYVNILIVYLSVIMVYRNIINNKGVLSPNCLLAGGAFYLIYLIYVILKVKGIIVL